MENHIYPLNIEEPTPLGSKSKRKKPSFKEWIKERKKMVVFVCIVAFLALATVTIYATGLSDKIMGFTGIDITTTWDQADAEFDITGSVTPKETLEGEGAVLTYLVNRTTNINRIEILKSDNTLIKTLVSRQIEITTPVEKTAKWDGKNSAGATAPAGNYKFRIKAEYLTVIKDPNNVIQPKIQWNEYTKEFLFSVISESKLEISGTVSPTQQVVGKEVELKYSTNIKTVIDKIEILKSDNTLVKKIAGSTSTEANVEKTAKWDGKNSAGATAPAGNYKFRITSGASQKDFTFTTVSSPVASPAISSVTLTITPDSTQKVNTESLFIVKVTGGTAPYIYEIYYNYEDSKSNKIGDESSPLNVYDSQYTFKNTYQKVGTYTVKVKVTDKFGMNKSVAAQYQITETKTEAVVPPPPTTAQCNDGIDNDTDGKVDFLGIIGKEKDPDCTSADDDKEESDTVVTPPGGNTPTPPLAAKETKCDDGKDNDDDGKKDYEDSDCKAPKDASIKITDVGVTSQKLNPALNAVKIYYKLSDSANVKVEIKSTQGNITVPLFDGKQEKQTGNFSVWWEGTLDNKPNGQKAPDGTYTYKISATHLKYPSVKDSKEGTITVDSTYNPGGLDFEDINNANLVGDTTQGQNKGTGTGQTPSTPVTPSQNQATVVIQSATTGSTAGTGPGVVIYFLFPLFAYAYKKIKY